ncbi:MAG TPA: response regulator [Casimicrobiaceae bacterium]|nr:response regulator [Casimicrobiaceae bacterium]
MAEHPPHYIVAVVDDDGRILESLEALLESAGHTAWLFASAAALLESGSLPEIDCLISDVDLPTIDGFELSRRVCAARPGLPIILITGHAVAPDRPPAFGAGGCRFFRKPFDGEDLLMAVNDAMQNRSERAIP